jgi:hypothetical protein
MLQVIIYYRKPIASLSQAYSKPNASPQPTASRQPKGHTSNDQQ